MRHRYCSGMLAALLYTLCINTAACAETITIQDVTGNVSASFPATVVSTDKTTSQAFGQTQLTWIVSTDNPKGAQISVYISGLTTPAYAQALSQSVQLTVTPTRGSAAVVTDGAFASGVTVAALPQTATGALNLCHTNAAGEGNFIITLTTSSPPSNGRGTISGLINLVATTTP